MTSTPRTKVKGFTLIEVMIVIAIVAILTRVALPSYLTYVKTSHARGAAADVTSLAANLENSYQLQLKYPVNSNVTATTTNFPGWQPTQSSFFSYAVTSTTTAYTITATGSGTLTGCTITLAQDGTKSATSTCGFTSW
jgi:type IV pilus assembly protein PilE